jgi:hypothetical protein
MAKIIEIRQDIVSIGTDYNTIEEIRASELSFVPHLGDEVEIFKTDTRMIVSKVEKKSDFPAGGININMNQAQSQQVAAPIYASGKVVNKVAYVVFAILLGGIGLHKFYSGKIGMGILYLIFCWTSIPSIIGLVEGIIAALKPADANGNIVV